MKLKCPVELYIIDVNPVEVYPIEAYLIGKGVIEGYLQNEIQDPFLKAVFSF